MSKPQSLNKHTSTTQAPESSSAATEFRILDDTSWDKMVSQRTQAEAENVQVYLQKRKLVGEHLRATRSSSPYWKWTPEKNPDEEAYWTGLAGMYPGLVLAIQLDGSFASDMRQAIDSE